MIGSQSEVWLEALTMSVNNAINIFLINPKIILYHAFFIEYLWISKRLLVSLTPTELNCIELKPTEKKFTFPFNPFFSFHIFHLSSFEILPKHSA